MEEQYLVHMKKAELIFFKGCPNAQTAKTALGKCGIAYVEVIQDDLAQGHPYRKFSSPTILMNGKVVIGTEQTGDAGCSIGNVTLEEMIESLMKIHH